MEILERVLRILFLSLRALGEEFTTLLLLQLLALTALTVLLLQVAFVLIVATFATIGARDGAPKPSWCLWPRA